MSETYFTVNLDESSPIGLLEVPVVGEESAHHNLAHANLVHQAIEASQMEDPDAQALVVEALYRGGGIPRDLVDEVQPTINEFSVAWPLRRRLYDLLDDQADDAPFTGEEIKALAVVLESGAGTDISYLTQDGLDVDSRIDGLTTPLLHGPELLDDLDEIERTIATELGTETYVYHSELVRQPDENGTLQPVLLSNRRHTALGHLTTDGTFEHVATVLNHLHPARFTPQYDALQAAGMAAKDAGDHEQALRSFEMADELAAYHGDDLRRLRAINPRARALWSLERYDEAIEQLETANDLATELNIQDERGIIISNMGRIAAVKTINHVPVKEQRNTLYYDAVIRFSDAAEVLKDNPHLYYRYANALHGSVVAAIAGNRKVARQLVLEGFRVAFRKSQEPYVPSIWRQGQVRTCSISRCSRTHPICR